MPGRILPWFSTATENLFLSIRARVILSYLVIVGIGFLYLTRKMSNEVRPRYLEAQEETMVDVANVLAAMAEQAWDGQRLNPASLRQTFDLAHRRNLRARIYGVTKTSLDLRVYVTDSKGQVVFDSEGGKLVGADYSRWNDVYLTLRGQYGARSTRTDTRDASTSVLHVGAPILHEGEIVGALTVVKPLTSMAAFMQRTQQGILLLGALAAGAAVLMGILFSAWLTYPIRNLIEYAKAIRDGRRNPRPHLGHSEIRTLGIAFEEMRDALEGKDYVNRYVRTLTHELKSPVAAIQGAAELLQEEMPAEDRRRFLANIQTETGRIQEAVESLLLLASVESKKALDHPAAVDLCDLARKAAMKLEARASVKSVVIEPECPKAPLVVQGDGFLLERALFNLLENAIAFSPAGASVTLTLKSESGRAVALVEDSGPGIPDYAHARVFERFYSLPRPDTGKKSSGLGLAFVREVILLHGGEIELRNRVGGGLSAELSVPLHKQAS